MVLTVLVNLAFTYLENMGQLTVSIAFLFGRAKQLGWQIVEVVFFNLALQLDQLFNLMQEPGVNPGQLANGPKRHPRFKGIVDMEQAVPAWVRQALLQGGHIAKFATVGTEAIAANFEALTGFLQGFLKISANTHCLTHRLHLKAQRPVGPRKLIEVPAWHLHNHIVNRGFKKR